MTVRKDSEKNLTVILPFNEAVVFLSELLNCDFPEKIFNKLIVLLNSKTEFFHQFTRVSIMLDVFDDDLYILFNGLSSENNTVFKKAHLFEFTDSNDLFNAIKELYSTDLTRTSESDLYNFFGNYRLKIISNIENEEVIEHICEFASSQFHNIFELAKTAEYGKCIIFGNAIENIGKYL